MSVPIEPNKGNNLSTMTFAPHRSHPHCNRHFSLVFAGRHYRHWPLGSRRYRLSIATLFELPPSIVVVVSFTP